MRITVVFTFHTVIKIKRGDTCETLGTMPGTKWVLTNLAIVCTGTQPVHSSQQKEI